MIMFYILYVFNSCILLVLTNVRADIVETICYNSTLEGFRLNSSILMTKIVSQRIDCIMECAIEPCCRSVNYKKSSNYENETNCEMLHDLSDTHDTSTELMKQSSAYDHVYLLIPHKNYNATCPSSIGKEKSTVQFFESNILSSEPLNFTQQLEEWLPKTGMWSICWRATRDGWGSDVFHSKCDEKIPTLTIVQVIKNNKTYVFGGYATVSWAGNHSWTSAPGSFLFSLRNHDDLKPFKAPLKKDDIAAIYRARENGPDFGFDFFICNNAASILYSSTDFGKAFQLPSGYTYNQTNTKALLAGSYYFSPAEVEVLYIKQNHTAV